MKKIFSMVNYLKKKRLGKVVIFIVVIILSCLIVFVGTRNYYTKQNKEVEVINAIPVVKVLEKEIQISGETIRNSMANIGKLCTAEYSYTHVEHVDSSKQIKGFKIPFTTSTFIYSYDGIVTAGIDFTKIKIDKNDTEKIITVILPNVEIISSEVDQNSFHLYDEKNNIFNPISVQDVTDSFSDLKDSEEKKAIEKGLFNRAQESAILLVENFMHGSYDIKDYEIAVLFEIIE